MAHHRQRYITALIKQAMGLSGIVGVIGHRQSGKTTLVSEITENYLTLDDKRLRNEAQTNPDRFIAGHVKSKSMGIDEAQLAPDLFPALKEFVRTHKQPGRFLLTGSVRFTSRTAIRESLTGRIINLELLPFSISELENRHLQTICRKTIQSANLRSVIMELGKKKLNHEIKKTYRLYLDRGGLPGICFIRNARFRNIKIDEQLKTILDRDIRLVYPTTVPYHLIFSLVTALAKSQLMPIDYTHLKTVTDLSTPTIKKLIYALEAVFLIRLIPIQGGRKGMTAVFEDQAESRLLAGKALPENTDYAGFIYRNIRSEFFYDLGNRYRFFHYLTPKGAEIPVAVETDDGILGISPTLENSPTHEQIMGAHSFLRKYANSKVIFTGHHCALKFMDDRMAVIPDLLLFTA